LAAHPVFAVVVEVLDAPAVGRDEGFLVVGEVGLLLAVALVVELDGLLVEPLDLVLVVVVSPGGVGWE